MNFSDLEFKQHPQMKGISCVVNFPNGYGASIIRCELSHGYENGLYELCFLKYGKHTTKNILGWLTEDDISQILKKISNL